MPVDGKVRVSLRDFVVDGRFDGLEIGQSKDWVAQHFVEPDGVETENLTQGCEIWRFGHMELHFFEGTLFMVFCDSFITWDKKLRDRWDAGSRIELDYWIFKKAARLNLGTVSKRLIRERITHQVIYNQDIGNSVIRIPASGVELVFDPVKDDDGNPNHSPFGAMSLSWSSRLNRDDQALTSCPTAIPD